MIQYSKSFRSIRSRTESLYDRARKKLASSFRSDRKSKVCLQLEFLAIDKKEKFLAKYKGDYEISNGHDENKNY